MSKKHKKVSRVLMCFHFCFCFFILIPIGIASSTIGLKICVITAGIKKYKLIIKKKEEACANSFVSKI